MTTRTVRCKICGRAKKATGDRWFKCCGSFQPIKDNLIAEVSYNVSGVQPESNRPEGGDQPIASDPKITSSPDQDGATKKVQTANEPLEVSFSMSKKVIDEEWDEEDDEEEDEEDRPRRKGKKAEEDVYVCGSCGAVIKREFYTCPNCRKALDWGRLNAANRSRPY